ncbi:hypothetical protein CCR97_19000 [Rhodoplanes elegans]|uniref:Phage gp6-like head-tail connector protein n=1 Tax=Rhodoplanes elegans TaxID=29408 RepID=A0A327KQL0_9BRAD|nr:hypothetical protein [Rhodoplanes elegans]MBK5960273.1 hypothetical protein [Rhodoplanes elegans]RAI40721.1 hypothetical protein CH338_05385 [Rhodoplanes elegans]
MPTDLEVVSTLPWRLLDAATLRANMRRSSATEDALLDTFIAAATAQAEKRTKLSILGRTLRLFLPDWPLSYVELPAPPLRYDPEDGPESAVTVKHRDQDGALVTTAADVLRLVRDAQVWTLVPGLTMRPALQDSRRAVQIEFTVGYASAADVPPDVTDAIVLLASHRDANREADPAKVAGNADHLLRPHTVATRYTPSWA